MVALLRYIYDLPYDEALENRDTHLQPHALVAVVAGKYHIEALQQDVCRKMQVIISRMKLEDQSLDYDLCDFEKTLRLAITSTGTNSRVRKLMVETCVLNIHLLRARAEFCSLLREFADFGADIVGHSYLDSAFGPHWSCGGELKCMGVPECCKCEYQFPKDYMIEHREKRSWKCESCQKTNPPICSDCESSFGWAQRRL